MSISAGLTITVIIFLDAASHKLFHHSLKGTYDLVSYIFLVAISFALSSALINGNFIKFDLFVIKSPKRIQEVLNSIVGLLGMALSILIMWQSFLYGRTLQAGGEISSTAKFFLYPFAYGIVISFFPIFLRFLSQFINSIENIVKNSK